MSSPKLSDAEISAMLKAERERLEAAWPPEDDIQKQLEAVQVIEIEHARNLATAQGRQDILKKLQEKGRWADLKIADANSNPYLRTIDPSAFCQAILKRHNPEPDLDEQISAEEALRQLSQDPPQTNV
jgi:hypothetical protein